MRLEGNDHIVEYNEVYEVVRETDDQGGIDLFYNVTYRGNILRYNYWHDIGSGRACGQAGIRLDDAISGTLQSSMAGFCMTAPGLPTISEAVPLM